MDHPVVTDNLSNIRILLLDLFCRLAYVEGDFTLSSGQKSNYYINSKPVSLHPIGAVAIARLMLSILPSSTEAIAGLTLGADPIVSAISVVSTYQNQPIPGLIIRKEAKGHGTRAYIEGPILTEQAKIVVVEDVVTTGQSALLAVSRLREANYRVDHVMALVDRDQGGRVLYESMGLSFQSLFTIGELQQYYQKMLSKS